ncbi:MAG: sulfite exporter TauE/SafE family protein [Myxococcales bacterium]|nr:sulfite exporter TauE/SafE family protein [Myxococcales bacterium]
MIEVVVGCGVVAGVVSTLAGQGGGLLALLALSAAIGPREALVLTAPGLAIANVHRAWIFRASIDRAVVRRMFAPIVVASLVAGVLAVKAPPALLKALLVFATALAMAKALGWARFQVSPRWLAPVGAGIGSFGAMSGGAGLMLVPVLVSVGLGGEALIATSQTLALALNAGRLVGYTAGGSMTRPLVAMAAVMTIALLAGNAVGIRLRRKLREESLKRIELATMCAATALVALGAR